MKKWIKPIIIAGIVIIILIIIGVAVFLSRCNVYYVSPEFYETLLGEGDPETFCQTKGKGTWLQGEYTYATVNSSGELVLLLTDKTVQEWKNSIYELQILQRALSSERDIGIEIDDNDIIFMEHAYTCGYDISDDYTCIIQSSDDDMWYAGWIMNACLKMQFFEGKPCEDISVALTALNSNDEIKYKIIHNETGRIMYNSDGEIIDDYEEIAYFPSQK